MENPIKMDDLGENPLFSGNTHKDTLSKSDFYLAQNLRAWTGKAVFFFRQLTIGQPFEKGRERDGGFRPTATWMILLLCKRLVAMILYSWTFSIGILLESTIDFASQQFELMSRPKTAYFLWVDVPIFHPLCKQMKLVMSPAKRCIV